MKSETEARHKQNGSTVNNNKNSKEQKKQNKQRQVSCDVIQQNEELRRNSIDEKNEVFKMQNIDQDAATPPQKHLWKRVKMYTLLFLVLFLALYCREKGHLQRRQRGIWPLERLLNYEKFRVRYPRIQRGFRSKPTEDSRRNLLFNMDLISLGRHNLAYLAKKSEYYMRQSPFKADRTSLEQMDVLNQLDEFNLEQVLKASRRGQYDDDYIVLDNWLDSMSFFPSSSLSSLDSPVRVAGPEVERDNNVGRWFNRLIKGDSYYEIPNYPLDKQPDPNKITHIDSDLRYCSDNIKDQGSCGACYAMSWTSYAEWHYCKQTGKKINFSEQHIVDCGYKAKLGGCLEGLLRNVQAFSQIFGFELEENYPWNKKEGVCKKENGSVQIKTHMTRIKVDRKEWEEILKEQPILLETHLPSDIGSYSRGVHPGTNCDKSLGHGMVLVGYGSEEGVPYWLLKNSMGKKWGENGYLRLSRDAPMRECFATGFIFKIKFKSVDEDKYNDFYDNIKFQPTVQPEETKIVDNTLTQWLRN